MEPEAILTQLLRIELISNAARLGFIEARAIQPISREFLIEAISLLNELSLKDDELSQKQLIAICALIWTYRNEEWDGLKNYLILFLSRAGFGPSSIMVDPNYGENQFSSSESLVNQFAISLAQLKNEVKIGEKTFLLSDFQKRIWDSIENHRLIGISAPTSAGKSFLILLKAIDLIQKSVGNIIYVVPTLSLVSQVLADFRKMLDDFGITDFTLESTYNYAAVTPKSIYVLTQEKAIAAFSQTETPFKHIRLLIIDEIQNVEKVADSDDQRSKVLYDLMIEMGASATIDHIIISGPRIIKIDELGQAIFGIISDKKETDASPVLNLTYSISRKKGKYYFNVYSDLLKTMEQVEITNYTSIQGYGKVSYDDDYLGYLSTLLRGFGEDESCLIFSPTSPASSKMAGFIAEDKPLTQTQYLTNLSDFIASTVHPHFTLVDTIKKGVAYHHGKLPFHVRLLVEDGIKQKEIKTIVCTTTLLQGVNLPVQNIIIRNPNLYTRKVENSTKLSTYEIGNLRGRAGRLLKDFVGRTYILDEKSFKEEESEQLELFKGSAKELQVGYGQTYSTHKDAIKRAIVENIGSTNDNETYSFLTTYLRQAVIKYGINSQQYLQRVGIKLTDSELNDILQSLEALKIDRNLCARNRYWDPVDLNSLFLKRNQFSLPTSATEQNIAYRLKSLLQLMNLEFSIYYKRYFNVQQVPNKDVLLQKCILAESWLKERPLAQIFNSTYYDTSDKIDDAISFLQNKISYGLPLLLKPLYDIKGPEAMFTRFIEMGAYRPITRRLIELSIPRETAIYLANTFQFNEGASKVELIDRLRSLKANLPYWYRVQLTSI